MVWLRGPASLHVWEGNSAWQRLSPSFRYPMPQVAFKITASPVIAACRARERQLLAAARSRAMTDFGACLRPCPSRPRYGFHPLPTFFPARTRVWCGAQPGGQAAQPVFRSAPIAVNCERVTKRLQAPIFCGRYLSALPSSRRRCAITVLYSWSRMPRQS